MLDSNDTSGPAALSLQGASSAPRPISSRNWSLEHILSQLPGTKSVQRIDRSQRGALQALKDAWRDGQPMVLEGFNTRSEWNKDIFSLHRTRSPARGIGSQVVLVKDVDTGSQQEMPFSAYIDQSAALPPFRADDEDKRLHAVDITPPKEWLEWLKPRRDSVLPSALLPLGHSDMFRYLPVHARAETVMCYFGLGDTYSPWFKDPCGSLTHNLLVDTNGNGSSFFFIVGTRDVDRFSSWLHSLGQEIDQDNGTSFTPLSVLKNAPCNIYITEQQVGDLIVMPPRAAYQRFNHRGINSSIAWSRMETVSLPFGIQLELPIYNRIGRAETYRTKLMLLHSTAHYAEELRRLHKAASHTPEQLAVVEDLLELLDEVLINEYAPGALNLPEPKLEEGMHLTCDFCASDIFITYFECTKCRSSSNDPVALCGLCYASGRTCQCVRKMKPAVVRSFQGVLDQRNQIAAVVGEIRGGRQSTMTERRIIRSPALQTSHVAHIIYAARGRAEKAMAYRQCKLAKEASSIHAVHPAAHLTCNECDLSICFAHIVQGSSRLHATRAARLHSASVDSSSTSFDTAREIGWHKFHSTTADDRVTAIQRDEENQFHDLASEYLAAVANKYPTVGPSEERGCTKSGWYDCDTWREPVEDHERLTSASHQEKVAELIVQQIERMQIGKHAVTSVRPSPTIRQPVSRTESKLPCRAVEQPAKRTEAIRADSDSDEPSLMRQSNFNKLVSKARPQDSKANTKHSSLSSPTSPSGVRKIQSTDLHKGGNQKAATKQDALPLKKRHAEDLLSDTTRKQKKAQVGTLDDRPKKKARRESTVAAQAMPESTPRLNNSNGSAVNRTSEPTAASTSDNNAPAVPTTTAAPASPIALPSPPTPPLGPTCPVVSTPAALPSTYAERGFKIPSFRKVNKQLNASASSQSLKLPASDVQPIPSFSSVTQDTIPRAQVTSVQRRPVGGDEEAIQVVSESRPRSSSASPSKRRWPEGESPLFTDDESDREQAQTPNLTTALRCVLPKPPPRRAPILTPSASQIAEMNAPLVGSILPIVIDHERPSAFHYASTMYIAKQCRPFARIDAQPVQDSRRGALADFTDVDAVGSPAPIPEVEMASASQQQVELSPGHKTPSSTCRTPRCAPPSCSDSEALKNQSRQLTPDSPLTLPSEPTSPVMPMLTPLLAPVELESTLFPPRQQLSAALDPAIPAAPSLLSPAPRGNSSINHSKHGSVNSPSAQALAQAYEKIRQQDELNQTLQSAAKQARDERDQMQLERDQGHAEKAQAVGELEQLRAEMASLRDKLDFREREHLARIQEVLNLTKELKMQKEHVAKTEERAAAAERMSNQALEKLDLTMKVLDDLKVQSLPQSAALEAPRPPRGGSSAVSGATAITAACSSPPAVQGMRVKKEEQPVNLGVPTIRPVAAPSSSVRIQEQAHPFATKELYEEWRKQQMLSASGWGDPVSADQPWPSLSGSSQWPSAPPANSRSHRPRDPRGRSRSKSPRHRSSRRETSPSSSRRHRRSRSRNRNHMDREQETHSHRQQDSRPRHRLPERPPPQDRVSSDVPYPANVGHRYRGATHAHSVAPPER